MTRTNQMAGGSTKAKACSSAPHRRSAFTLIELLAVIGIIALLAALIVPLTALAVARMKLAKAGVELKDLETAILSYKSTTGFYPPDNPNDPSRPPLFYELNGTIYDPTNSLYHPMYQINVSLPVASITSEFSVAGFVNSTQNPADNPVFTHNFSAIQFADDTNGSGFKLLICPVHNPDGTINSWRYNSSNPTNNPNTFDLWVDLVVRGKTNRVSNWSTKPVVL